MKTKAEFFETGLQGQGIAFEKTVKRDDLCRATFTEIFVPCDGGRGFVQAFFTMRDGGPGRRRSESVLGFRSYPVGKRTRLSRLSSISNHAAIGNGKF